MDSEDIRHGREMEKCHVLIASLQVNGLVLNTVVARACMHKDG